MSAAIQEQGRSEPTTADDAAQAVQHIDISTSDASGNSATAATAGSSGSSAGGALGAAPTPAGTTAGSAVGSDTGHDLNLLEYSRLQQRIAELQGLQVEAHVAHARRAAASLQRRLAAVRELEEDAQHTLHKADEKLGRLDSGGWYLGKLLLQNKERKLAASHQAVEDAAQHLKQRERQVTELRAQLHAVQLRLDAWEIKAGELVVAQVEAEVMEERLFGSPSTEASVNRLELVDALCALEVTAEEQDCEGLEAGERGSEGPGEGQTEAGEDGEPDCQSGEGHLLRIVAPRRDQAEEGGQEQQPHSPGNRLLRVTAEELTRAAAGLGLQVEVAGPAEVAVEAEGQAIRLEAVPGQKSEAAPPSQEAPAAAAPGRGARVGEGRLLRALADKLGRVDPARDKDAFGGYGRGRLLRIAADGVARAAAARRHEREAAVRKLAGALGAHPDQEPAVGDESLRELFPPWASSFNPALHCPPSTFLWTFPNRFMGRLQKLRTGDTLHAYYRFGPLGASELHLPPRSTESVLPYGASGAGLPLLMLPGLGSTMIAWGVPLMRALSVSHEVIIMDYRGAGLSRYSGTDPWDYFAQAEAVLMLADALNIPKFDFVGWSSGGNVGLILAALHGHRLGRMVSHAGVAGGKNTIAPPALKFLDPDAKVSIGQTMALVFPPDDPQDFRRTCARYIKEVYSMPKSIVDQEVGKKAAREQYKADREYLEREEHVWDALPQVKVPCLISNGTADVLVPQENAERLVARIPGAKLHLFQGWGHGWKDSAAFANVIDEFLCGG